MSNVNFRMQNQKSLFQLDPDVHYLNCAYLSPQLKSVEQAGMEGMKRKNNPMYIKAHHFFDDAAEVKQLFGQMINAKAQQVAIIPSTSYGFANALNNVPCKKGQHIICVSEEFPSGYFAAHQWAKTHDAELITIGTEANITASEWHEKIMDKINDQTAAVLISSVHWSNGIRFKLKTIGAKCKMLGAKLIVDGTQSVGAYPINVVEENIDVLVCAAYKWLMGPYATGLAYYDESFNEGKPIEESWMNRTNAMNFSQLANYDHHYTEGAGRYNVGQNANMIQLPMMKAALSQILAWEVSEIQYYCESLMHQLFDFCNDIGAEVVEEDFRSNHLVGIALPESVDFDELTHCFQTRNIISSVRGSRIRISPHVYNTQNDIEAVIDAISICSK